jgi:hypothetical protein
MHVTGWERKQRKGELDNRREVIILYIDSLLNAFKNISELWAELEAKSL